MFNEVEKQLLREMRMHSAWAGILEKLRSAQRPVPRYVPGQGNAKEQELDWIYYSGVDRARDDLLKLLANE